MNTTSKTKQSKKISSRAAYIARRNECLALIEELSDRINNFHKLAMLDKSAPDWSYAGTMCEVARLLTDVNDFMGPLGLDAGK